jgi:glycosyltransferase involved in cell wall biosynthesis
MCFEKLNILFDASVLATDAARPSGIYFVAYNVLREFAGRALFSVTLYVRERRYIRILKREPFLARFRVITLLDREKCFFNIAVHKQAIRESGSIIKKAVRCLQIVKNYLALLKYQCIKTKQVQRLKAVNVFLSPARLISKEVKNYDNIKRFMILHDIIPVMDSVPSQESTGRWFRPMVQSLDTETYCFCISENTRSDFLKIAGSHLDKNKMFVTPNAPFKKFFPHYDKAALRMTLEKYGIENGGDYIFSLCTIDPRKNLLFTIGCFIKFIEKHNIQDLCFYLGGGHFTGFIKEFEEKLGSFSGYQKKIVHLGYIDNDDVNILLSNALFFTFLSQYEGFGMPPLEAMQAGTPVITSNNSSLPEVVGDAAITITYNDEAACIKAFEDLYFNKSLREEYIAKGLERAKLFSWEKTVDIMAEKMLEAVK